MFAYNIIKTGCKLTMVVFWLIVSIFIVIVITINTKKEKKEEDERNLKSKNDIPCETKKYKCIRGLKYINENDIVFVWIKQDDMCVFSERNDVKIEIPFLSINYYTVKGNLTQELEKKTITGFDSGISAMNKLSPDIKTIDERKTIINATIENKNVFIFFEGADLYDYLLENIPEKEQSFVAMSK